MQLVRSYLQAVPSACSANCSLLLQWMQLQQPYQFIKQGLCVLTGRDAGVLCCQHQQAAVAAAVHCTPVLGVIPAAVASCLHLQASHSVSSHSSITSCSRQAQLHPTCLPVPQHRLSCKQAVAPNTVARAGSNGNGTSSTKQQQQHISIIASDVDGTLLNSQQQLTPAVEAAVKQAAAAGVPVRRKE